MLRVLDSQAASRVDVGFYMGGSVMRLTGVLTHNASSDMDTSGLFC